MWTHVRLMVAALAVVVVAGCETSDRTPSSGAATVDTAAERATIQQLETEWSNRFTAGDVDWIVDLHTADAVQLPPGAPLVQGREALRAAWQGLVDTEGLGLSWSSTEAFVSPDGQMAYDHGTAELTTPDGAVHDMKYLVVWVREDGEWKVAADMFNANSTP